VRIRPRTAAATVGAAALLLAGCGSNPLEGKTGPQVAAAAADALEAAGAVHVVGAITADGQEGRIDLQLQGEDAIGSMTVGGTEIQLITAGGTVYWQAPLEFWASFGLPDGAAATFENRWVIVPAEASADFAEFSLAGFANELRNPSDGAIRDEVSEGVVDGEDVVVVRQENGSTLKVAAADPSYPLEMSNAGDSTGTVRFDRFGETTDISAPVNPLDLSQLAGG
jgi:hypothetical protein